MNNIPKDAYADALLLNVQLLKAGAVIKRDAYADELLHYVQDTAASPTIPLNEKAPDNAITGHGEDGKE